MFSIICNILTIFSLCLSKNWSLIRLLPITKWSPYYIRILFITHHSQVYPSPDQFIDKAGVITLINKNRNFFFLLKKYSTDPIASKYILNKNLSNSIRFFNDRFLLLNRNDIRWILICFLLSRHSAIVLHSNKIERSVIIEQIAITISFMFDSVMNWKYFR